MIPSSKSFDNPGFKDEPLGCATHAWSPQKKSQSALKRAYANQIAIRIISQKL